MIRTALAIAFGCLVIIALGAMANAVVFHGAPSVGAPPVLALLLLMHGLAAIAGGYLAAAIGRRRPAAHGFAAGVLFLLAAQFAPVALDTLSGSPGPQPLWMGAAAMGVTLLGSALGGVSRGQTARTTESPAAE